jgi:Zn-dependent protease/predicted transcriptional regulator
MSGMGKSVTLFTIYGFKVKVDISWLAIAVLLTWTLAMGYFPLEIKGLSTITYWVMGAVGALGLFVCIVLHEFGHSIVARQHGIPMRGITLFIFGGVAEMEEEPPTARSEFLMAIAGPVVSIVLAGFFYLSYLFANQVGWPIPLAGVLYYLAWINAILVAFNLVPAFPLDGGRVLRAFLWSRKHNLRQATRIAASIGSGFGIALIILGVVSFLFGNFIGGVWWFLIGLFLRGASRSSLQQVEIRRALQGEPTRRFMHPDPVAVPPSISLKELVENYMYRYHYQMFPVLTDSTLLGCISTDEVKKIPREEWSDHHVEEILTECSKENTISADTDAVEVLTIMRRTGKSRLMVMDQGRLVGVISLKDLLKFLSMKMDLEGSEAGSLRN